MKTLLVMAGGTGGHVYPALAVAQSLIRRGVRVIWLGTRTGLESRVVLSNEIELECVEVTGVRGVGLTRSRSSLKIIRAFCQAVSVIRRRRPDALLGMGGYVSGPGAVAGLIMRLPLVIHEANSHAGITNQLLAHFATHVLTGFPEATGLGRKMKWVGNPVRPTISACRSNNHFGKVDSNRKSRLLVMGGSQGAEVLNKVVPAAVLMLPTSDRPEIIHQCGQAWKATTAARYSELGIDADVVGYIEDVASAYKNSDLVICRAGAMTLAEISVIGVPSLLIPFPHAVGDHQSKNAEFMAKHGAARVMFQNQLSVETLAVVIAELLADRKKLSDLAKAARSLACIDATELVAGYCREVMGA